MQKFVLVPYPVCEEMVKAACAAIGSPGMFHVLNAAIASAPHPPALGGEPEVLAWMFKQHDQSPFGKPSQHIAFSSEELTEVREGLVGIGMPREEYFDWQALVDRSHVTRLQAEVERLTARNAELVKAGKNLLRVLGMANSGSSAYNKAVMEFDAALAEGAKL